MTEPVDKQRLLELERLYKHTREQQVFDSRLYHYNDGRVTAIRELRIELFGSESDHSHSRAVKDN